MSGVTLDKEHGVNPGMENCFICNQPKGIILYGQMNPKKREMVKSAGLEADSYGRAPNGLILDKEPCHKCAKMMKRGVILISVRDDECVDNDPENPHRTGGWVVVKDDLIQRIVQPPELADSILSKRMAFVPDAAWDMLGLPRGAMEGVPSE